MASAPLDRSACPLTETGSKEWTTEQRVKEGPCHFCRVQTTLRFEPFSSELACKTCWELIVYGTDDD